MTRKSREKRKAADFPPEFLDAWEQAAAGVLKISFTSKGRATNFRQQLHAFRKALIEENGLEPFARFYNYDLVVNPNGNATGYDLVAEVNPIKAQIRDAAVAFKLGSTSIPIATKPEGSVSGEGSESTPVEDTLKNLGFNS